MQATVPLVKQYLLASDFDQTLSFNDSGLVLSELVGIPAKVFEAKVATLAVQNLVQQGGELIYLLLHDPEYRARVRKEHLLQAGKGVRLKKNIRKLSELLATPSRAIASTSMSFPPLPRRLLNRRWRISFPPTTSTAHICSTTAPDRWNP